MGIRPRAVVRVALVWAVALGGAMALSACAGSAVPSGLTSELVDQVVSERRDELWERYFGDADFARPEVEIVAYTPPDELMQRYVSCMHDAGFDEVHQHGDGLSLGAEGHAGKLVYLALWVCAAQYPVHPALLGYLPEGQREYLWDYWDSRTVPCLRGLGFDVPDLADRDAFVAAQGGYSWSPYEVVDPSGFGWDGIDEECPPLPEETFGAWHP